MIKNISTVSICRLEVINDTDTVQVSEFHILIDQNHIIDFYLEMLEHCDDKYIFYIDDIPVKWFLGER